MIANFKRFRELVDHCIDVSIQIAVRKFQFQCESPNPCTMIPDRGQRLAPLAPAQPAPQTEAAQTSKLTGTSFGATPDRDLRPQVISNSSDYLAQLATQADPASQVSDVEVIFWRNAVKPQAVEAYQKLVTDNLSQGGYTYTVTGTQSTAGQTTTLFTAESNQQG